MIPGWTDSGNGQVLRARSSTARERRPAEQEGHDRTLRRAGSRLASFANHLIRIRKLGLPQNSRDAFDLPKQAGIIDEEMNSALKSMVGFRNVLMHEYRALDPEIVDAVIRHRLDGLLAFTNLAVGATR